MNDTTRRRASPRPRRPTRQPPAPGTPQEKPPPPRGVEEQPSTPAIERGDRLETGKAIHRGGHRDGHVPGAEPSEDDPDAK